MYTVEQLEKKIRQKAILFKNETDEDKKFEIYKEMVWIERRIKESRRMIPISKILKIFQKRNDDLSIHYDISAKAFTSL